MAKLTHLENLFNLANIEKVRLANTILEIDFEGHCPPDR